MTRDNDSYISDVEEELREIYEGDHLDTPMGPVDWIFAALGFVVAGVWLLIRFAVPLLILVGIVGAMTGIFDKEEVPEDRSNPGWEMVRELQDTGEISEFKAVEPDEGWLWQYELDSYTEVRFRRAGGDLEMEYRTRDSDLEEAIDRIAAKHGFFEE